MFNIVKYFRTVKAENNSWVLYVHVLPGNRDSA